MDNSKPNILDLFLEAEENLLAQFDPSSDTFHRGDPTPVPVGGERVPDSMPTPYDVTGSMRDTPMDPDYCYLVESRSTVIEFKKILSQVGPAVEAIAQAQRLRDPVKRNNLVTERQKSLIQVLEKIKSTAELLLSYGGFAPNYSQMIAEIYTRAGMDFTNKQTHTEFMQFLTACTQKVFKDSQIIMQKIKSLS